MRPHIRLLAPLLGSVLFLGGCSNMADVAFFASAPQSIVEETTQTKAAPAAAPRLASSSRPPAPVAKPTPVAAPITTQPVISVDDVDGQYARSIEQMNITQARWDREAREAIRSICGNC